MRIQDNGKVFTKLRKLGLHENEAVLYVALLQHGPQRIKELCSLTELPRSSVYEYIGQLQEFGLIEEIIENNFKLYQANSISVLRHKLADERIKLLEQRSTLDELERTFDKLLVSEAAPVSQIQTYHGQSGARQIFWNSLKAQQKIYVYSEWGRGRYVGIEFYKKFVEESKIRKIEEHVITNDTPRVLESITQHIGSPVSRTSLDTIKLLPISQVPFKGETLIYDDTFAQIFLKGSTISGFEIKSKQFAKVQRAIFQSMWQSATPTNMIVKT